MIQEKQSVLIKVLSVIAVLICLLLLVVRPTNAWFYHKTSSPVVQFSVHVKNFELSLYQDSISNETKLTPATEDDDNIRLSGALPFDQDIPLSLLIRNEDSGSSSVYVRFKFEVYALKADENVALTTSVTSGSTFSKVGDYYYFQNGSGANQIFTQPADNLGCQQLMSAFQISSSNLGSNVTGSETIRIVLTIESSGSDFAE